MKVDVFIPCYDLPASLQGLLNKLASYSLVSRIHILHTDQKKFRFDPTSKGTVTRIRKADFHHARTRNLAKELSAAPFLLFLTEDVADISLEKLEGVLQKMEEANVAVTTLRQIPLKDHDVYDRLKRYVMYPYRDTFITQDASSDQPHASNTASLYHAASFSELGGFSPCCDWGEDNEFQERALHKGYAVLYTKSLWVKHSHNHPFQKKIWLAKQAATQAAVQNKMNAGSMSRTAFNLLQTARRHGVCVFTIILANLATLSSVYFLIRFRQQMFK